MNSKARRIVEYILAVDEEDLPCEACFDALDAYIDAQLVGEDATAQFPGVARHLNRCPACWQEYHDLYQLLRASREGTLHAPPSRPALDLSAILPPDEASPQLWAETAEGVRRLAAEIAVRLEALRTTFAPLPPALQPCHATMGPAALRTTLSEDEVAEGREILALPDEEHDVLIRLGLGPVMNERGVLILEVEQLATEAPIDQAKVTLSEADGSLLESTATNPEGIVIFRDLGAGQYRIGVEHDHKMWHLLVSVTSDQ